MENELLDDLRAIQTHLTTIDIELQKIITILDSIIEKQIKKEWRVNYGITE